MSRPDSTHSASQYPEHDKLRAVADESQALGEFLDMGLGRLFGGMQLYEHITRPCECDYCAEGRGGGSPWHSEDEKATRVNGVVQIDTWQPTHRTVKAILAEYFGIDQAKLDAEKEAMLEAIRRG